MSEIREIAAILAADVVGFSRLAGADEDRTLARLRALRSDLLDPTTSLHHGRVVKRTGDGAIIEFRSVVDAVRCAIEIQNGMVERNAGLPPERRIEFRIGIHLGDVVEESDGDLMGDGVNIAARLEGIAGPGAICLSEDAYRQVSGRLDMAVADLGQTQLKNIERSIRVYSLQVGVPSQAKPAVVEKRSTLAPLGAGVAALFIVIAAGAWYLLAAKGPAAVATNAPKAAVWQGPTVAVLPFVNESGDANNDAPANRLAEDTIGYLGNFSWLRIVGRSAGSTKPGGDPIEAARQMGADYVLTGNLRSGPPALRVTFQLDDAHSGARIASSTLEPTAEAIRASAEAEVAGRASALLAFNGVNDAEFKRAQSKPDGEWTSFDCIVQAYNLTDPTRVLHVRQCLEAATNKEAANANAWAALALVYITQMDVGWGLPADEAAHAEKRKYLSDKVLQAASRAVDLAPHDSRAMVTMSLAHYYYRCAVDLGRIEGERAIALNPYDPWILFRTGMNLAYSGHWDEGTALAERAIAYTAPATFSYYWLPTGARHWARGEYQKAYEVFQHSYIEGFWISHLNLAYTLPFLDRLDEAKTQVATLLKVYPTMTIREADAYYRMYCFEPSYREKMAGRCARRGCRSRGRWMG